MDKVEVEDIQIHLNSNVHSLNEIRKNKPYFDFCKGRKFYVLNHFNYYKIVLDITLETRKGQRVDMFGFATNPEYVFNKYFFRMIFKSNQQCN